MFKKLPFLLVLLYANLSAQSVLIDSGSAWNYLDDGSDQETEWQAITYDDSSWSSGQAQLGYGEDEITEVSYGDDSDDKHPTTYFRKSFTITDPTLFDTLILEAIRDDGMVVYINGVEVWSDNMPESFEYDDYAEDAVSGAEESEWITKSIASSNLLVSGTNVVAVEIHQADAGSSDLSFDFKIAADKQYIVAEGQNWNYLDNGSNQGTNWYAVNYDDSNWGNGPSLLGYKEDEATTIDYGTDPDNKHTTTYFRKYFTITDTSLYNFLLLEAIRDDGMVVYLNGVQIWSDNMPDIFDYETYSEDGISGSDEDIWISKLISSNLVTGQNVIAVEIHQASPSSSDLSFNFRMKGLYDAPIDIVRGPYLQTGTPTSIVIKWRTNFETESVVNFGTALGNLNTSVEDTTKKIDHEITITGLDPNTKYFYEIGDLNSIYEPQDAEIYVKTSPNAGTKQFVRAWILGDPGTANPTQEAVKDQYYNHVSSVATNTDQTDMMLFLGDNAYDDGTDEEYQVAMFDMYDSMLKKSVAWSTIGNHDAEYTSSADQTGPYYDIFTFPKSGEAGGVASGTEAYYSFDYGNIHFIVLDSHELYDDQEQMDWCLSDIQSTTQDWIVAFFHHPIYSKGSHDTDKTSEYRSFAMRENFQPILEENGVDLILNGHSHAYERSYFVNGHYGTSDTFDANVHIVGDNGYLSGKEDTADGAYIKTHTQTEGAVYMTTGSAGHNTGGDLDHSAMYSSLDEAGSCILETTDDTANSLLKLNIQFLNEDGEITDYFTVNKPYTLTDDADGDGIDDDIEINNGTDQNNPCDPAQTAGYTGYDASSSIWAAADCDNDGVINGDEVTNGTDPYQASGDTDGDGIDDDIEINNGTDQNNPCDPAQTLGYTGYDASSSIWAAADCDDDGVANGDEVNNSTDPYQTSGDTDGDGIDDDTEINNGTDQNNPCDPAQTLGYTGYDASSSIWAAADCDDDGVANGDEVNNSTDPYQTSGDTDGDGIDDDIEINNGTDQNNPCDPAQTLGYTGYDASSSIWAAADCDDDGVANGDEVTNGTDPYQASGDTDGDGIDDDIEINNGTDQNNPCDPAQTLGYTGYDAFSSIWAAADCDNDGVTNGGEVTNGTDPYQASGDSDDILNSEETMDDEITSKTYVYPNPVSSEINIELGSNQTLIKAKIFSVSGAFVKESYNTKINVDDLETAPYIIEIETNTETIRIKVIVK